MSTHYTTRGGSSNNSYICGSRTTGLAGAYNYIGLHIGATLSFRLSTHYSIRGGLSSNGSYCGVFYIRVSYAFSVSGWYVGVALYCKVL